MVLMNTALELGTFLAGGFLQLRVDGGKEGWGALCIFGKKRALLTIYNISNITVVEYRSTLLDECSTSPPPGHA